MSEAQATQQVAQEPKNDIEQNLAKQRVYYENKLNQERQAREEAERKAQELAEARQKNTQDDDDDDDSEPYVDRRKLTKTLNKFGQQARQETQSEIQKAVHTALQEERKQNWMKQNNDFYDVMKHVDKLATSNPELAESILTMPDNFERQQLVYKNIKALKLHLPPEEKKSDVQDRVNKNRTGANYSPSGLSASPYANTIVGDFSEDGRKAAYERVQQLRKNLRI